LTRPNLPNVPARDCTGAKAIAPPEGCGVICQPSDFVPPLRVLAFTRMEMAFALMPPVLFYVGVPARVLESSASG